MQISHVQTRRLVKSTKLCSQSNQDTYLSSTVNISASDFNEIKIELLFLRSDFFQTLRSTIQLETENTPYPVNQHGSWHQFLFNKISATNLISREVVIALLRDIDRLNTTNGATP